MLIRGFSAVKGTPGKSDAFDVGLKIFAASGKHLHVLIECKSGRDGSQKRSRKSLSQFQHMSKVMLKDNLNFQYVYFDTRAAATCSNDECLVIGDKAVENFFSIAWSMYKVIRRSNEQPLNVRPKKLLARVRPR